MSPKAGQVRCTASGQVRSVPREEWGTGVGTCPDCGGPAPLWVRGTDLPPRLKVRPHYAPPGVVPTPNGYANAQHAARLAQAAAQEESRRVEIRDDAAGTDSLIEAIVRKLDGDDVPLRGEEWRATADSPYSLTLRQWADRGERDEPTGPRARVTFTVHVEDVPA